MEIEVIITKENQKYFVGKIALIDFTSIHTESLKLMRVYIKEFGCGKWLNEATYQASQELDNCTKKLIMEAKAELIKAKTYMKSNYSLRYKISFIKVIIKNPFKTLIATCLLRSK